MANVPRISDITGKKSGEETRNDREWQRYRKQFQNDTAKHGFGTDTSKEAWRRRADKTRSK